MSRTIVRHAYPAVMAGMLFISFAQSGASAASAVVKDMRIGEHPGATRVVLDISQRTNATFDVSADGRTLFIVMPDADWRAGDFAAKHAKGLLTDFRQSKTANGLELSLLLNEPVRMKPPFFVSPEGSYGERVVIDLVPDPTMIAQAANPVAKAAAPTISQTAPAGVPLAAALPTANPAMMPPADVAMERRTAAAAPVQIVPQGGAPVEVAQASYSLSPSRARTGEPVQSAQAMPQPPMAQPMPSSRPAQPAEADSFGGLLYVKAAAGINVREEANAQGGGTDAAVESDFGWVVSGGLGLDLKNNFRLEGEMLYSNNTAKSVSGRLNSATVNAGQAEGDVSLLAFMANLNYDFATPYAFTPYIFGGAGLAVISVNGVGTPGSTIDDSDAVFAMQGGAGLSTELTDRTALDLSYRYLETLDAKISDGQGAPLNYDYQSHMIMLGLRYKL